MRSIPTIFVKDKSTRLVINKRQSMVDWVFAGKGIATRKWDGVAIMIDKGKVYRRTEWKLGEKLPSGFIALQSLHTHSTMPGWVPVPFSWKQKPVGPDEKALCEAWESELVQLNFAKASEMSKILMINSYAPAPELHPITEVPDGTYELCGPSIHGNHEKLTSHVLYRHGLHFVNKVPRTFEGLKKFLETYDGEGIVWHYRTGSVIQMAKVKRSDFGFYGRPKPIKVTEDYFELHGKPKPVETVEDSRKEDSNTVISDAVGPTERKEAHA